MRPVTDVTFVLSAVFLRHGAAIRGHRVEYKSGTDGVDEVLQAAGLENGHLNGSDIDVRLITM
jgi:hypothetical protein